MDTKLNTLTLTSLTVKTYYLWSFMMDILDYVLGDDFDCQL